MMHKSELMRKFDENKIYMMKRTILLLSIMCLGMTMSAQSGIIESRKANDASGKILTMEETILSRELSPESVNAQWSGAGELVMMKDGKVWVTPMCPIIRSWSLWMGMPTCRRAAM